MKNNINPKRIDTSIEITLQLAQNCLYKLRFEYKDIHKDILIDGYQHLNMVKHQNKYFNNNRKS